jgi:hypothetical protein
MISLDFLLKDILKKQLREGEYKGLSIIIKALPIF